MACDLDLHCLHMSSKLVSGLNLCECVCGGGGGGGRGQGEAKIGDRISKVFLNKYKAHNTKMQENVSCLNMKAYWTPLLADVDILILKTSFISYCNCPTVRIDAVIVLM